MESVSLHNLASSWNVFVSAGGSKDREWSHQPQGCRAGWFCGSVQNQKAYTTQQTHEGLLWTTGEFRALFNLTERVLKDP